VLVEAVQRVELRPTHLQHIVLVGGSARWYFAREAIRTSLGRVPQQPPFLPSGAAAELAGRARTQERAVAAESLANEAEQAAARAAERYALTGDQDDLAALRRWEAEAEAARREAEATREEAERLHKYLP